MICTRCGKDTYTDRTRLCDACYAIVYAGAPHCRLCDQLPGTVHGYCEECRDALLTATPEECAEDPDVAWHVATLKERIAAEARAGR